MPAVDTAWPSDSPGARERSVPRGDAPLFFGRHRWRHRFAILAVLATLFLIFAGGLVTSTGSGLSVPDWPKSYGMWMPPMVGGVFYEHGHRMIAAAVGALTLVLAIWTARSEPRRWLRRLTWGALLAVIAQGILGGLTVLYLLPTPISVSHACLAQTFFCMLIAAAYATSREWMEAPREWDDTSGVTVAAAALTGAVYLQLLLGALMRHTGAGLAIPDFPLAFGRLIPPFEERGVVIHFAHRIGAALVLVLAVRAFAACRRAAARRLRLAGSWLLALVLVQIGLGAVAIWTERSVTPTTFHVATGAAILGLSWLTTLRAARLRRSARAHSAPAASA